ncbi:MAG: DUF6387 family protein [Pseudohongiellaceae bacterium]
MNKRKIVRELPTWFSIENYSSISELNIKELYSSLNFRAALAHKWFFPDYYDVDMPWEEFTAPFLNLLKDPNQVPEEYRYDFLARDTAELDDNNHLAGPYWGFADTTLVSEMSMGDFVRLSRSLAYEQPNLSLNKSRASYLQSCNKVFGELTHEGTLLVTVNVDAKDSEIVEDFRKFLKLSRIVHKSEEPIKTEKVETIADKIIRYRVIPYWDLTFWSELNNLKIKDSVLVNGIFPDKTEFGEYELRMNTRKYAKTALSYPFLSSLDSYANR